MKVTCDGIGGWGARGTSRKAPALCSVASDDLSSSDMLQVYFLAGLAGLWPWCDRDGDIDVDTQRCIVREGMTAENFKEGALSLGTNVSIDFGVHK